MTIYTEISTLPHVEPHHVAELLNELGIRGELEVAHPVGLQPVRLPDPPHLAVMSPMHSAIRRVLQSRHPRSCAHRRVHF